MLEGFLSEKIVAGVESLIMEENQTMERYFITEVTRFILTKWNKLHYD